MIEAREGIMRILVINLNTSKSITAKMRGIILQIKRSETDVDVVCPEQGPITIDSSYDEAYAVPPTLELVKDAQEKGYHAILLGCFCDAGVEAAREISNIPVIAMEESTLAVAITLGSKFGILTEKRPRIAMKELHVRRAGLLHRLASIRALGLSTGELDARPEEVKKRGFELARKMVDEDGAEVIIMGCTAMAGYSTDLERQLQVPILDPTIVAFKYAEMIAHLGISHSRIGLYHPPMPKKFESKK
jgi:allantoin racemase